MPFEIFPTPERNEWKDAVHIQPWAAYETVLIALRNVLIRLIS